MTRLGFEPRAHSLKGSCSTDWANGSCFKRFLRLGGVIIAGIFFKVKLFFKKMQKIQNCPLNSATLSDWSIHGLFDELFMVFHFVFFYIFLFYWGAFYFDDTGKIKKRLWFVYTINMLAYGPCAGALADESPKSKIIQKCQNVNWPWGHQKSNLRKWQTPLKVSARRAGLESGVKMVDSWVIWWVFYFFLNRKSSISLVFLIFWGPLGLWPHARRVGAIPIVKERATSRVMAEIRFDILPAKVASDPPYFGG